MRNLSDFIFTPRSDRAESFEGWNLNVGSSVDALSGNDTIMGIYSPDAPYPSSGISNGGLIETAAGTDTLEGDGNGGIFNSGTIHTGASSDTVIGIARGVPEELIDRGDFHGLTNSGIINSGSGDDLIQGSAGYSTYDGINNTGAIYSGPGDDEVRGSSIYSIGIFNEGKLRTACGNDRIIGSSESIAIYNIAKGTITTGEGNDIIEANSNSDLPIYNAGLIDMGSGSDTLLTGTISNQGVIDLGDGNDRVISEAVYPYPGEIYNTGLITTGAGSDIVDMPGGIYGEGTLDLGTGNDTLIGFSPSILFEEDPSMFIGGAGIDTLTFASGSYQVEAVGPNEYLIDQQMRVSGFERFGRGAGFLNLSEAAALGSVTFV
jgi:hypothetical protein